MSKISIKITDDYYIIKANICFVKFKEDCLVINFGSDYNEVINTGRHDYHATNVEINEYKRIEREIREYLSGAID